MDLSLTEENYLKSLLHISQHNKQPEVGTNELADFLSVKPATANSMLKRLREKNLVCYEKYGKITLSAEGANVAKRILRKHRLWETFLYKVLGFGWDEVHEVAEQLEHVHSPKLIERLDQLLGFPQFDPHGDPIPDKEGNFPLLHSKVLAEVAVGATCKMVAVKDDSSDFLQYVVQVGLGIDKEIQLLGRKAYDGLTLIAVEGKECSVSQQFAENIYVELA